MHLIPGLFLGGVFAQCAHSTNYYSIYPGNTPENHPPTEVCMINSKTVSFRRLVFSTLHSSKNMYCNQYTWVTCVKQHLKVY